MAEGRLQGLFLVGAFDRVEPVARKSGEVVPGFFNVFVNVGTPYSRRASFSEMDRETFEETRIHEHLASLNLRAGEQVAVRVVARSSDSYVNLDAVQIIPLEREAAEAP